MLDWPTSLGLDRHQTNLLCRIQDHSLVETEDNSPKAVLLHGALKGVDLVLRTAPEHGPEVIAEGIGLGGLANAPSVETMTI